LIELDPNDLEELRAPAMQMVEEILTGGGLRLLRKHPRQMHLLNYYRQQMRMPGLLR
jgi:hypothetical protein